MAKPAWNEGDGDDDAYNPIVVPGLAELAASLRAMPCAPAFTFTAQTAPRRAPGGTTSLPFGRPADRPTGRPTNHSSALR